MSDTFLFWLGLVADIMQVLGVGGVISWSLLNREASPRAQKVLEICFMSFRFGMALLALLMMLGIAYLAWGILADSTGGTSNGFVCDPGCGSVADFPATLILESNFIATLISALIMLPICLIVTWSVATWSTKPFTTFKNLLFNRNGS